MRKAMLIQRCNQERYDGFKLAEFKIHRREHVFELTYQGTDLYPVQRPKSNSGS